MRGRGPDGWAVGPSPCMPKLAVVDCMAPDGSMQKYVMYDDGRHPVYIANAEVLDAVRNSG